MRNCTIKYSVAFILFVFSFYACGQDKVVIPYDSHLEYDQEYGLHQEDGDYKLIIEYSEDTLRWKSDEAIPPDICHIQKKTSKYIIGVSKDGTYVFYNIQDKRLFYLMKWETTYSTYGVGKGPFALRESVTQMMHVIQSGGNETDVIEFLTRQAEYDF